MDTTATLPSLPTAPAEAPDGRAPELGVAPGSAPDYVVEAFRFLVRELDRKQGMIDELKQYAETGFGLSPEDCELLEQTVTDRDHLKTATDALAAYFY